MVVWHQPDSNTVPTSIGIDPRPVVAFAKQPPRPVGPRGYRTALRHADRDPALRAARDLHAATARRLGLRATVRAGKATAADRRAILERLSLDARHETRALTGRLLDGSLGRPAWVARMRSLVVPRLYAGAMAALGGELTDADRAWIEAEARRQLAYLKRFGVDMATGAQPHDGRALVRADQYGAAVWVAGQNVLVRRAIEDGFAEYRAVLGARESCRGCLDRAVAGWQPIGTLKPLGDSPCRSFCHCNWDFRRAA